MSRLTKESEIKAYNPPMLLGLDSLNDYLSRLNDYVREEIKGIEKSRQTTFSTEEEWTLDGNIGENIIELGSIQQILIESALVAFYSYLENQLHVFCEGLTPVPVKLQEMASRGKGDSVEYKKLVIVHYNINEPKTLQREWSKIENYRLMRNYIVHATMTPKKRVTLSQHIKSDTAIWYNSKHESFAISIEYVKDFSHTIASFLSELDYLVYQKTGSNTLI